MFEFLYIYGPSYNEGCETFEKKNKKIPRGVKLLNYYRQIFKIPWTAKKTNQEIIEAMKKDREMIKYAN